MFYFCDESKSSKIKTCKNVFSLWTPSGQKLHWVRFTLVCVAQHRHLHLVCSQLLFFLHLLERSYSFARSAEKDLLYGLSGKTACMLGLGIRFFVLIFYETTQWVETSTLLKLSCWKLANEVPHCAVWSAWPQCCELARVSTLTLAVGWADLVWVCFWTATSSF